jgi:hypothetical protein
VFRIAGKVTGPAPAYAVVAYAWPASSETDHGARTFIARVNDGEFVLPLAGLQRDTYQMRLVGLQANGGTVVWRLKLAFDGAGQPDVAAVEAAWNEALVERAERWVQSGDRDARVFVSDEVIAQAASPEAQRKLRVLRAVVDPVGPVSLGTVTADRTFLSDVEWAEAKVGWGQPARNHYWFDEKIQNGVFLALGGEVFAHGLYAHSPSRYVYDLNGKWKTFTATVGLRDGAYAKQGSAVFKVLGDGRELYRSPMMRVGTRQTVEVEVGGVQSLALVAEGGEGHNFNSWAIWVDPLLKR